MRERKRELPRGAAPPESRPSNADRMVRTAPVEFVDKQNDPAVLLHGRLEPKPELLNRGCESDNTRRRAR